MLSIIQWKCAATFSLYKYYFALKESNWLMNAFEIGYSRSLMMCFEVQSSHSDDSPNVRRSAKLQDCLVVLL